MLRVAITTARCLPPGRRRPCINDITLERSGGGEPAAIAEMMRFLTGGRVTPRILFAIGELVAGAADDSIADPSRDRSRYRIVASRWAAGHSRKSKEVTMSGRIDITRHPLKLSGIVTGSAIGMVIVSPTTRSSAEILIVYLNLDADTAAICAAKKSASSREFAILRTH
jgi:hypothetical protein